MNHIIKHTEGWIGNTSFKEKVGMVKAVKTAIRTERLKGIRYYIFMCKAF